MYTGFRLRRPPARPATARWRGVDIVRAGIGLIWLAGAAFNAVWTTRHGDLYQGFADDSPVAAYRWFFREVVAADPLFWTVLLVIGEVILGVLVLGRGHIAKLGLAGSMLWSALLFPLLVPSTLMMGPYALGIAWLLRFDYPTSLPELLRGRRHGQPSDHNDRRHHRRKAP